MWHGKTMLEQKIVRVGIAIFAIKVIRVFTNPNAKFDGKFGMKCLKHENDNVPNDEG